MKNLTVLQFTIILLIGLGILMRKLGIVSKEGQKNMTDLVLNLILPCNIVASFMGDIDPETISQCLLVFVISVVIQIATAIYGLFAYRNQPEARKKNLRYAIMCSNAGFMGSTIAEGVFGAEGLMLSSIYLIPQRVVMWSAGIAIFSGEVDKKKTLKKVITHPCVIACFVGIAVMLLQVPVPDYIRTPITTLGRCNTALCLLIVGMILSDADPKEKLERSILRYTAERLLLVPLAVLVVCRLLHLPALTTGLSVLLAAMPAGASTGMLAAKYDQDPVYATKMILFSTLCSVPSIFLWTMMVV